MNKLPLLKKDLDKQTNKKQAAILQRFFKTRKGEYGYGDIFLGIKVPVQRSIARKYLDLDLEDVQTLLKNKIHEYRLVALIIMVLKFNQSGLPQQEKIYKLYLKNYKNINNWDLVDLSAPNIVGQYLLNKPKKILYDFANSQNLWKKRIAIISTFTFIRQQKFSDTIKIAKILLKDKHDLIHKAVGWMLREAGKRNEKILIDFLDSYSKTMPRTMLRYAIEKLPENKRLYYLNKEKSFPGRKA